MGIGVASKHLTFALSSSSDSRAHIHAMQAQIVKMINDSESVREQASDRDVLTASAFL